MAAGGLRVAGVALAASLVLAGCSGGSSSSKAKLDSGSATTAAATSSDGSCAEQSITGTVDNSSFTGTASVAVSLEKGKAYTLYVTDFPISTSDISMVASPEVPAGKTLFMVADTVFNAPDPSAVEAVAPGDKVEWTSKFGVRTFTVMAQVGAKPHGNNSGGKGTLEVTKVGDLFCGTIEYHDDEKELSGTFAAPVKDL